MFSFGCDRGNTGRDARAQIADRAGYDLHRRAARHDLAFGKSQCLHMLQGHTQLAGVAGVVVSRIGLSLLRIDHHIVDENAGNFDILRWQGVAFRQPLDLDDDDAALAPAGLRGRYHLAEQGLVFHGDVAVFVGGGAAQQCDVDPERLVAQPFLAIDRHQLDQIVPGARALPSAQLPRIHEGVQAHLSDETGAAAGDVAGDLRKHALRQSVGLDLVLQHHGNHGRRVDQRTGDAALDHAVMTKMGDAFGRSISEANDVNEA